MVRYGLVGRSLSHSFSKKYFQDKFSTLGLADHEFLNFEMNDVLDFRSTLQAVEGLRGVSVTLPYKTSVITHLDEMSEEAVRIGAVNCVKIAEGRLTGYNTDAYGFSQSIKPFLENTHERALILGTGGASRAVAYSLRQLGIEVFFVSRAETGTNTLSYKDVNANVMKAFLLVINCTPLGMSPAVDISPPIPYHFFSERHLAYDLIYNPAESIFLQRARESGASTVNGLSMLHQQAEKSWEIWNGAYGKS